MVRDAFFNWLEDECFYSLCSRQHGFWANSSSRETLASLFEVDIESYSHDFPTYLNKLKPAAVAAWGNSEDIIYRHTIAPLFFPFQSAEHVGAHKEAMKGNGLGSIKYKLGLITGHFGSEHPLKACTACILDDRHKYGVAYWHLSHQLPGVTICPIHNSLLRASRINRQWSRDFCWQLPSEKILITPETSALSNNAVVLLKRLSLGAVKLLELGDTIQFEPHRVSRLYQATMSGLGAPWQDRSLAADDFKHHCVQLREHHFFSSLPCSNERAIGFISQMTRQPRSHCHPLKHLVFISWLFGSFESFFETYHEYAMDNNAKNFDEIEPAQSPLGKEKTETKGVAYHPIFKPKKMFVEVKKRVLASLAGGASKNKVCEKFGISVSTINRILRLNPIVATNISAKVSKTIKLQKREKWMIAAFSNPILGIKGIRQIIPDIYAWLYRNDKDWLTMQNRNLPSGRRGNNSSISWDDRDEDLCARITDTIIEHNIISETHRKYVVYELVPGLYSALESKSHYAKTRKLLAELTKPDGDFCSTSPVRIGKN